MRPFLIKIDLLRRFFFSFILQKRDIRLTDICVEFGVRN